MIFSGTLLEFLHAEAQRRKGAEVFGERFSREYRVHRGAKIFGE